MKTNMTTLPNGLRVITARLPGFDSASVAAFIDAGSRNENPKENGIAHFLEHLAFKSTSTRSALQIASEVENLGSNINAYTSNDVTAYYVNGLGINIANSVEIIGDVLCNSLYAEDDIETERGVILQEISRSLDNPGHVAYDGYGITAFPDQALGRTILGPPDFIKTATRENFTSFVGRCYTADNMLVVGVGDFDHNDFVEMVAEHFTKIPMGTKLTQEKALWGGGYSQAISSKFEQVTALIGWDSVAETDPTIYAHRMLAWAIGSGMSSPLFQEVREKRGLVYTVNGSHDSGPDYGQFMLYAGTTPDKLDEVIKVSCDVFMNAATSITDNDMLRARNMALVGYSTIKERPFSLARYLASNVFDHGKIITPDEEKINFSMVTKNDLLEAAAMIFKTKPTVSLVGPVPENDYMGMVKSAMG
jgi:predicted Zn-dependent peptidase